MSWVRARQDGDLTQAVALAEVATREARAAEARLSSVLDTLIEAVSVGTAVRDATGRIVDFRLEYTNAASTQLFGLPAAQLLGRCWSEMWPTSFASGLLTAFTRTVETGRPVELSDYEVAVDRPDGVRPRVVDLRVARLDDGVVVAWRDVTARRAAVRAVAAAAARFAAAFDHAPVGMALVDLDGSIVRANPAYAAITQQVPEDLAGTSLLARVDPRDLEPARADLERLRGGEPTIRGREHRLLTPDGEPRWVSVSIARVGGAGDVHAIAHVEDIHERKAFEHRLQYLADHDALTGLFNRRRFHEELAHQVALDARYDRTSAVAIVDLDNFKYINDTLGHATGDRLIQVIAHELHGRLRGSDVIGRLGGDEFGVLLPGADLASAVAVAESLLAGVHGTDVEHAGRPVRSTASIGVAQTGPLHGGDADDVLANADLAMYAAKESGRNTVVVYDPTGPHAARSRARFRWLDRIRYALDHDLFTLHAQPILDLGREQITGCELLLRMRDDAQLIRPDRFLHVAERHGLATAIDRYVITRGIAVAAAQERPPGFRWEINLSADALADPEIPKLIETELSRTELEPAALVFEITETAAITNMDQAQAFATGITDIGCRFALDDFGAGYGSFYYLKHFPFEYLKIDGEFIRQLTTSRTDRVIVQAIVTAAQGLGKQTIAEYVGDAATLDLLRAMRVDHAQGFHVGHPAEPEGVGCG